MKQTKLQAALHAATENDKEEQLIAVLQSSEASRKDKVDACRELGVIGTKKSIKPLAQLLDDEELSHMARYGLEPNPDPAVDEVLREALKKVKGLPLVGVIGSVGFRRDEKADQLVAEHLKCEDSKIKSAAARALGSIGTERASKDLMNALEDANKENRVDIFEGLLRCAEALFSKKKKNIALKIYNHLLTLDEVPHQVRAGSLRGVVLLQGKQGIPTLIKAIQGNDFSMVQAAALTAQEMKSDAVVKAIADVLDDLSTDKQIVMVQTLGTIGSEEASKLLKQCVKSENQQVAETAKKNLAALAQT